MEIDIRTNVETEVEVIRFADDEQYNGYYQASIIRRCDIDNMVSIKEGGNGDYVQIAGKEHAHDLIKALEKAIELGWLE